MASKFLIASFGRSQGNCRDIRAIGTLPPLSPIAQGAPSRRSNCLLGLKGERDELTDVKKEIAQAKRGTPGSQSQIRIKR